jgi:hypothetical protein
MKGKATGEKFMVPFLIVEFTLLVLHAARISVCVKSGLCSMSEVRNDFSPGILQQN